MNGDDLALSYEAMIRKCWNCERTEHHANADIYRKLRDLMIDSYKANDFSCCQKIFNEVVGAIIEALKHKGLNKFAEQVESLKEPNYASLEILAYTLGQFHKLNQA